MTLIKSAICIDERAKGNVIVKMISSDIVNVNIFSTFMEY